MIKQNKPMLKYDNKKSKSKCIYCYKSYTNKTSLEKHMLLCCIIYKSKRQLIIEEEEKEILSQNQMSMLIKELILKVKKLEEKVETQDKYINKMKKKINIIDWLNSNIFPNLIIENFISSQIWIKEEDILFMMHHTFHDTLDNIFEDNFSNKAQIPMFCFDQKPNYFYIYTCISEKKEWIELNKIECIKIFNIIYSKIFKKLLDWKQNNEEQLKKSDPLDNLYMKTMGKILGVDFKQEATLSKAKTSLFNKLKTDMKQIVEYEFI